MARLEGFEPPTNGFGSHRLKIMQSGFTGSRYVFRGTKRPTEQAVKFGVLVQYQEDERRAKPL